MSPRWARPFLLLAVALRLSGELRFDPIVRRRLTYDGVLIALASLGVLLAIVAVPGFRYRE